MRHHRNDWLDDDAPEPDRGPDRGPGDREPDLSHRSAPGARRRTRRLGLLAVLPWLVVAGLVGAGYLPSSVPTPTEDPAPASVAPRPVDNPGSDNPPGSDDAGRATATEVLPPAAEDPFGLGPVAIGTVRGAWRLGPEDGDAAALAVAVARAWLTGIEPRSALVGISPVSDHTYVEHLAVEAVERPAPDAAVVTLLAVLLERRDEGEPHAVRISRLSVPIAFVDDRVRPAGSPWWVRPPDLRPVQLPREQVRDPDLQLAALDALLDAGFEDTELLALESTPGWPWIATVTATAPDGSATEGEVWLRQHLERFAVAGTALRPPGDPDRDDPDPDDPDPDDPDRDDPDPDDPDPDDPDGSTSEDQP